MQQMKCSRILAVVSVAALALLAPTDAHAAKEIINSLGMKLIPIEPGEFTMGQGAAPPKDRAEWLTRDEDEAPAHKVKITTAFFLGIHEVTNAQYEKFDPE